ncbi:hypothetical protein IWQ61_005390 [Dispira simplex]|nr:hypothetical protein IWQ61_005390 [Dispira simplex]
MWNHHPSQWPDIHASFRKFNQDYFEGKLDSVGLQWCTYMPPNVDGRFRCRTQSDSALIDLNPWRMAHRPMKQIDEFLLHMMIHTYLDHCEKSDPNDKHGPNFQYEVFRVRRDSGLKLPRFC